MITLLGEVAQACRDGERSDLDQRMRIAAARLERPATVICVVGEFKQGKSHVVNALIGREVCPVDDDLATAVVTVIGHGREDAAFVHRVADGERTVDRIDLSRLAEFASEAGNPDNCLAVDMIEVTVPNPVLGRGLTVVDTPGAGALRAGHDTAMLSFLPYADALIFITDASAELTPPELRFLATAMEQCPAVLVGLTKIDLYPEWRRIAEADGGHLASIGLSGPLIPLSSSLRAEALQRRDASLNAESRFPDLLSAVEREVIAPSARVAAQRALGEIGDTLAQLLAGRSATLAAMEDPTRAAAQLEELEGARRVVARLTEASARWVTVLNDAMADLRTDIDFRLRTMIRDHIQRSDQLLATADPQKAWIEITDALQTGLAADADGLLTEIREGGNRVAEEIAAMIEEDVPPVSLFPGASLNMTAVWASTDRSLRTKRTNPLVSGLTMLRGGYSGMLLLGMLGKLAGMAVLGPATLGVGAFFGARQVREERQRQVEKGRQEARVAIRRFLDETQLELSNRTYRAVQGIHRDLRDHFGARIQELLAAFTQTAKGLSEAINADRQRVTAEIPRLQEQIGQLENLVERAATLGGTGTAP